MNSPALLDVREVTKRFGGLVAVDNVSLAATAGRITALIGPNGAGKSTMLNLLSGIYPPSSGRIQLRGRNVAGCQPHQIARLRIARTFQTVQLFGNMTVVENVMVGLHMRSRAGFVSSAVRMPWAKREERKMFELAVQRLDEVGLTDRAHEIATNLPFGQQRLLEIARALAAEPEMLLLDEPAAGLSMRETEDLALMVQKIRDAGIGVLVVDHDMRLIMDISDEVVVLDHGTKIAEGTPREVQSNPAVISAYLGEEA